MDVKLAFFLGLFFIVTVNSDVRHPDVPKMCDNPSHASGGSLNQMVGSVY